MASLDQPAEYQNRVVKIGNLHYTLLIIWSLLLFYAWGSGNKVMEEKVLYFLCMSLGGWFTSVYLASYANKTEKSKDSPETSNHLKGPIFKSKTSTPSTQK